MPRYSNCRRKWMRLLNKLWRWKDCLALTLVLIVLSVFTLNGCNSILVSSDYAQNEKIALDANDVAPFDGMLISFDRYYWFLKCENEIIQRGILP